MFVFCEARPLPTQTLVLQAHTHTKKKGKKVWKRLGTQNIGVKATHLHSVAGAFGSHGVALRASWRAESAETPRHTLHSSALCGAVRASLVIHPEPLGRLGNEITLQTGTNAPDVGYLFSGPTSHYQYLSRANVSMVTRALYHGQFVIRWIWTQRSGFTGDRPPRIICVVHVHLHVRHPSLLVHVRVCRMLSRAKLLLVVQ